jgi:(p)ppGpp synthase/HD superfamily hydrolase
VVKIFGGKLMTLLEECIALAVEAHRGDKDKAGRPYILHPLHLMSQMDTEEEMMTAVLHDVVEDSGRTVADLRELGLPEAVIGAVGLLTHDKETTSYDEYVQQLKSDPLARKVKLADLRHNMDVRRLHSVGEKEAERLEKYRRALAFLME